MTAETEDIDLEILPGASDEPIPSDAQPLGEEVAPKRGRGRPKGSKNRTSGETAPKRGRPAGVTKIKAQIAGLVATANFGLTFTKLRDDVLSPQEMTVLTDALTAEAMASDRISRWLLSVAGISPHFLMIQAVTMIAIPRLQRRGILPKPASVPNGPSINTGENPETEGGDGQYWDAGTPIPVETGGAFVPFR